MDREAVLKIKELYDRQREGVRGVLLGAVKPPDAEKSQLTLRQRYENLNARLEEITRFYPDYDDPAIQVTPAVDVAEVGGSTTPRVMMRFVRYMPDSARGPGSMYAEFFDASADGGTSIGLEKPMVGFLADLGQLIAREHISASELDFPYDGLLPGEDPRTPEQRMTLMEQSLQQFEQALSVGGHNG